MSNPILVEVLRGVLVESRHAGAVAVADADGRKVLSIGDVERPVYPRSAVKAFQALPLIESGAADHYGLSEEEIALALSSHGGEPRHVAAAASMLAKCGRDASALECGVHAPSDRRAAEALWRAGEKPSALHHTCSGKHAGFVCLSCHAGRDPFGYITASHPSMREVMGAVAAMAGPLPGAAIVATDGCSIPTQAVPLASLARGFARLGTGAHLPPERARAAGRLRAAAAAHPYMIAGTGRFCTAIMEHFGARIFVKMGAEGVYCAALPELGFGVALKCDDGTTRASEVMMAAAISRLLPLDEGDRQALARHVRRPLRNWNGIEVGEIRPAGPLA